MVSNSHANRLAESNSPYLLQHAHNPVNWQEWSGAAFALAKEQNRLVFLSIGYSTCHWCHVMEKESFEDEEVAALVNSAYIAIKVDREQRPDIDQIYMDVCQALTGGGGWPLTIILTPDQKPVFAGTYFPKRQKYGRPGLIEILSALAAEWRLNSQKLQDSAQKIAEHFAENTSIACSFPDESIVIKGVEEIAAGYDHQYGGFTAAPKFPMGHVLELLLNHAVCKGDGEMLKKVEHSLLAMYRGGIFDHLGGGFCRYSTDERWLVPHFEKMLYDNALLLRCYASAFKATGKAIYREVAEAISEYVLRDLENPDGGFYSAEDADSEGHEGRFYVFAYDEFMRLAGEDAGMALAGYFGVTPSGNFEDGLNVLHLSQSREESAALCGMAVDDFSHKLADFRQRLFVYRSQRTRPPLDDKVITGWNGLMLGALALTGRYLGRADLIDAARRAAVFVRKNLANSQGRLLRCWRRGKAEIDGFFEDYSFLAHGLLELFRGDYNPEWLKWAAELHTQAVALFAGRLPGSYYETPHDGEKLLFRPRNLTDGALPSARSILADNSVLLAGITGDNRYVDLAAAIFTDGASLMLRAPTATAAMLNALRRYYQYPLRILIHVEKLSDAEAFAETVEELYLPDSVVVISSGASGEQILKTLLTDSELFSSPGPVVQICHQNRCLKPVASKAELLKSLRHLSAQTPAKPDKST
ncbi:MAG TPA: thioredoxin domain-containing protein [Candidatus Riflebacteria bacterium]|nr:thioredoxin domain-containing protein [Candidatus Riflebacteria bacterium]